MIKSGYGSVNESRQVYVSSLRQGDEFIDDGEKYIFLDKKSTRNCYEVTAKDSKGKIITISYDFKERVPLSESTHLYESSGSKKFTIDRGNYEYHQSGKSIGLKIKRSDGVWLSGYAYFPLSQVVIKNSPSGRIEITIPEWLLKKKVSAGYSIVQYW